MTSGPGAELRPAVVCRGLLAALDAAEGRRRRRKRDTTPDRIGLEIKRALLDRAVQDDPSPAMFETWLLERCLSPEPGQSPGSVRAMALEIVQEWRLAAASDGFQQWLTAGAPSEDRDPGSGATAARTPDEAGNDRRPP